MPTKTMQVAIVNKAKTPLGADLSAIVQALQVQVSRDFAPIYGVDANLMLLDAVTDDYAVINLWDNAQQAGALGEHHVSPKGHPLGNVYVKVTLQAHEFVSTVVSHELLELLGDPMIDVTFINPKNDYIYAGEACDAVEQEAYNIDSVPVSNFVTLDWYNPLATGKVDFMGNCSGPFVIDNGGYANVKVNGNWTQIFGSQKAFERYHRKDHDRSPVILKK